MKKQESYYISKKKNGIFLLSNTFKEYTVTRSSVSLTKTS